jgi:hypothetical protein
MVLAQAWNDQIQTGQAKSRADLARQLGVSRAHVTQVLRLIDLSPQVKECLLALGDFLEGRIVGAHTLRTLARLPAQEQEHTVTGIIGRR